MDPLTRISAFRTTLGRVAPEATIGRLSVDLDDLLGTLEAGVKLLYEFMAGEFKDEEMGARLQGIEIFLHDDVPMIARDVLPSLSELKRVAYAK